MSNAQAGPRPDLVEFARANPETKIEEVEDAWIVRSPWGDDTVVFRVSREATELCNALNVLRLPPRFTAIWHRDTRDLEFIFAPLPRTSDLRQRRFTARYDGHDYTCEYADASSRLPLLASAARPAEPPSDTHYRNLTTLRSFLRFQRSAKDGPVATEAVLTSFWVRDVHIDETKAVELARHLNFYMHYYDRQSPKIALHAEPVAETQLESPTRFPYGPFPEGLIARRIDPYLLGLWDSSMEAHDSYRHFLYSYQVLEYAAFYYMREEVFQTVRRILAAPDIPSRIDDAARQMLDAVVEDRTSDESKMVSVIQQAVDPALLWKDIESRAAFFSAETRFDGGFLLPPLIKREWGLDDFRAAWIPKLPDALRKLRNALVHAREQRMSKTVAPTAKNQHLLRPWANLATAVAMQIMIFRE